MQSFKTIAIILERMIEPMTRESAWSTIVAHSKIVSIASTSAGFDLRLGLYMKSGNNGVRYYGSSVDVAVQGQKPRKDWLKKSQQLRLDVLLSAMEADWRLYKRKVFDRGKPDLLGHIHKTFKLTSETLAECTSCKLLILPINDLHLKHEKAETRLVF